MKKSVFIKHEKPLTLIVCFDPVNGKSVYETYPTKDADFWVKEFEKDFPNHMVFRMTNEAGIKWKKEVLFNYTSDKP